MAETKTKPTKVSVAGFIDAVENDTRRKDAKTLLKLFSKVTGWKARMWGPTIVGFGAYHFPLLPADGVGYGFLATVPDGARFSEA
jgi:hypothetical protein